MSLDIKQKNITGSFGQLVKIIKFLSQAKNKKIVFIFKQINQKQQKKIFIYQSYMRHQRKPTPFYNGFINVYFKNLNIQYLSMRPRRHTKNTKSSKLSSYKIATPLPFKITTTFTRACLRYQRDGHWTQKEKLKYCVFISFFRKLFNDPNQKKTIRLYEMMSDMIITRNSNQCRSHHQKMEKSRNNIPEIISSISEKYEPTVFKEIQARYLILLKVLLENKEKYIKSPTSDEPVKYIYTTYVVNSQIKNTKKEKEPISNPSEQQIIAAQNELQEEEQKKKKDLIKTSDSYRNQRLQNEEDSQIDETPFMEMLEIPENHPQQEVNLNHISHQQENILVVPKAQKKANIQSKTFLYINPSNKSYYQQQIKMLEAKKQWHLKNIQQLEMQLIRERQSVKNCETIINRYQMVLDQDSAKHSN